MGLFYLSMRDWILLPILFAWIYLLPPGLNRLLKIKNGFTDLENGFSPWWASYCLQRPFYDLPWLENILRSAPGLYSCWLRLWGSKIGQNVYWSPTVEICDRGLLEIGSKIVFGHRTSLISHVITPKKGRQLLYVSKVVVGSNSFIGAGSVLGPGSNVRENTILPVQTILKIGRSS